MNLLDLTVSEAMQSSFGDRTPSDFQTAIFDAIRTTDDPVLIEAVAGSGKTTTIIWATEFTADPTMFLAFAKANAEDVKGKISKGEAKTLNALGHRLWMQNAPGARLDAHKDEAIVQALVPDSSRRQFGYVIGRLIATAKNNGYALDRKARAEDFAQVISEGDWDIDDQNIEEVSVFAARCFEQSRSDMRTFDFNDQLYGPVYHQWQFPSFGTILVDEAQDLNRIQHLFVEELVKAGARLIAVGDRNQAIYAFRGALSNSMDLMKEHFKMLELPLSVCYRCPTSVIMEAQKLVPHILARPGAPEGKVLDWAQKMAQDQGEPPFEDPEFWPDGHLIVCRNNSPLFLAVMRSVRARRPCRVLSNTLDGLASFIRKFRVQTTAQLTQRVERWLEKEVSAAKAKGLDWKVASLEDKAATVYSLSEGFQTVEEVVGLINQLKDGRRGPTFATVHKAKGLEADHVYVLRPDLIPPWYVKEPEALRQEQNIKYVAITRARETLTWGMRK